ncbi:MAG TPA: Hsp20/alpha crystallin family protein [Syntrophorhabdales bacterium]|nr:Hsp20/alpha crystallin family protein [Syntrophorhabdales bacterium]
MAAKKDVVAKTTPGTLAVSREWEYPFGSFQREMNKLVDDFFGGFNLSPWAPLEKGLATTFTPRVNVSETDKEIKVSAELPGMDEKDIDVSLTRDTLTIKGEKKEEKEEKGEDYYRMERSYGSFTRSVPLPVEVDTDKVQATFKKGVLDITLPKTARAIEEMKKVPVKSK